MAVDRSLAVGGFVLGGFALGVAAILLFGGLNLFTTQIRAVAQFPGSVAGLSVGAPVTFRGVTVGSVEGMHVSVELSDLKAIIPVFLDLDPSQITWAQGGAANGSANLRRAIEAGLRAQLVSQSLVTGQVGVDLDFRPGAPPHAAAYEGHVIEIPTVASDIQHVKDELVQMNLPGLADHATKALASVQRAADALGVQAVPLAQSALQTAADARATLKSATTAIHALQENASKTIADLDLLVLASRRQVLSSGQNIDRAVTRIETLATALDDAVAPRSPMRGDLEASLRDLAASASSLRLLTRDLQRNPGGTLLGHSAR
jgi:paraquat-inducible protein B